MRGNKFLKLLSYFLIPILIAMIVVLAFYELRDETEYFASSKFAYDYMNNIQSNMNELIYTDIQNMYESDEKNEEDIDIFYQDSSFSKIDRNNYLIIYKNKAITNVYREHGANTIEEIKEYINSTEAGYRKLSIVYGEVETNSEILLKEGIKYLEHYERIYYRTTNNIQSYFTVKLDDFEIYMSYEESFNPNTIDYKFMELAKAILPSENSIYIIFPACSILVLIMIVYLIISVGHTKGKEGIDLNDIDKIPLEIILSVAFATIIILMIIIFEIGDLDESVSEFIISVMITTYLLVSYIFAIIINTVIKRIKSKTFVDTCWCLKICRWILRMIKKIINTVQEDIRTKNVIIKVIIYVVCIVVISFLILVTFTNIGWLIELIFIGYILYRIIREIMCFNKVENKLKEMYEGNNKTKLDEKEFTTVFKNSVKYINDVSKGFENAMQEGIKSERLKTELITNVSHDIKTPLTSIINYVDLLKQENIENEKAREYIGILDKKSQRLKKLTEDLVEASKVSSGNIKLQTETINICELIKQTTGEFGDKFKEKGLEVVNIIPEEEIYIKADNRYMYRIIENLFSNISKYALDNSRVYIDIKNMGNKVKIQMKNISKDKLNISSDELMQRFVRGDKARTTEGSGLGISISKSLTELQSGKFNMEIDGDLFKVELVFVRVEK